MELPSDQQGVLVERVELDSPADQAHLNGSYKAAQIQGRLVPVGGDVITAFDGQPVTKMADLQRYLQQAKPGQKITLTNLRDGTEVEVPVTLSESSAYHPIHFCGGQFWGADFLASWVQAKKFAPLGYCGDVFLILILVECQLRIIRVYRVLKSGGLMSFQSLISLVFAQIGPIIEPETHQTLCTH